MYLLFVTKVRCNTCINMIYKALYVRYSAVRVYCFLRPYFRLHCFLEEFLLLGYYRICKTVSIDVDRVYTSRCSREYAFHVLLMFTALQLTLPKVASLYKVTSEMSSTCLSSSGSNIPCGIGNYQQLPMERM